MSETATEKNQAYESLAVSARGIESLTKMPDRDVVEKAGKTKNGDKFKELYNGNSVLGSTEKIRLTNVGAQQPGGVAGVAGRLFCRLLKTA